MRLTRLEVENFKGIGERQVIEVRPITLLFGPNSAGKSTILQVVEYLHQILRGSLLGSDEKISSTGTQDWRDFKSLVHCHDLKKVIRIKADVKLNENFREQYFPINFYARETNILKSLEDKKFDELPINYIAGDNKSSKITDVSVAIEVAWQDAPAPDKISVRKTGPFLRSLEISINNQHILTVRPRQATPSILPSKESAEIEVNLRHYLLNSLDSTDGVDYESPGKSNIYNLKEKKRKWEIENGKKIESYDGEAEEAASDLKNIISPFSKEIFEVIHELDPELYPNDSENLDKFRISEFDLNSMYKYDSNSGNADTNFPLNFVSKNSNKESGRWVRLQAIFSEIVSAPIRTVIGATEASSASWIPSAIGPLRSIPPRGKSVTMLDNPNDFGFIESVNYWLESRFELDYIIERFKLKIVPEPGAVDESGGQEVAEAELENMTSQEASFVPQDKRITKLRDKRWGIYLDFVDVGVGMSQLVPVIVAAVHDDFGLVKIEQPELHLHPAAQVELGDLFIESARKHEGMERVFLIETHSEHLILRLLRRIRETAESELPPDIVGLKADDLSVIYVEPVRDKIRIKRMRIDEAGEFRDRWPNGFFGERAEELF